MSVPPSQYDLFQFQTWLLRLEMNLCLYKTKIHERTPYGTKILLNVQFEQLEIELSILFDQKIENSIDKNSSLNFR